MKAEVIAIGSELTSGQRLDTNSQWLSVRLGELGIPVHFHATVADELDENVAAFRIASERADLVVASGGLGPTQDDLTREALASAAGVPLEENLEALAAIEALFASRNRAMPERNRVQALFPHGAHVLANPVGTAPGVWMRLGRAIVACLPGVPSEMRQMFDEQVAPRLRSEGLTGRVVLHHKINLFGKGESEIEAQALDLTARGRNPEVGITAHDATISFRITASGATEEEARRLMEPTIALIRERFGTFVIGEGDADVAEGLYQELALNQATLATAESCTGGLVAARLTAIAGASAYYPGGVVSYSNQAKEELLGIDRRLLEAHGAVSPEVAAAMASGVRERFHAQIGLSVTGIAGPSGGTPTKPVGLVYLGLAADEVVNTRKLELGPEQPRDIIQSRAAKAAMNWVRLHLIHRRDKG
jgi:nicotinamide-nucleotide amidase